jgi:hypothetical protein
LRFDDFSLPSHAGPVLCGPRTSYCPVGRTGCISPADGHSAGRTKFAKQWPDFIALISILHSVVVIILKHRVQFASVVRIQHNPSLLILSTLSL